MTPLRLTLSAFTCFKETAQIDFDGLSLFAISGPTGAGKSTLLDAMTYALYGQIARLGSKGLDLISPGMHQMSVQFEFQNHQGIYRVTRTLDRKKTRNEAQTRIEKLDVDASWKQLPESEKIKEANLCLERLVGLDYEGFTRAILLPQGAFDEFLRGDPSQRRQLLVSLLNLDKVQRMQQEAGIRAKQAELQIASIKSRLDEEYKEATPERKRALTEQLNSLLSQQADLSQKEADLQKRVAELEELKRLFDERANVQKELLDLKTQEDEIRLDKDRLDQGRRVVFLLPLIDQVEALAGKLQRLEADCHTRQTAYDALAAHLEKASEQLKMLTQKSQIRLPEIEAQLAQLAAFLPLLEQLRARGGSLDLASQASGLQYSEDAWERVQEKIARLPLLQQADQQVTSLEQEISDALERQGNLSKTIQGLEKRLEGLTEKGKQVRLAFEDAKAAYEQALIQDQAAMLRDHLHEGDQCPVCEQPIAVLPVKTKHNVPEFKQKRDDLEQQLMQLRSDHTETRANLLAHQQRLDEQKQHVEALRLKHEDARQVLRQGLQEFSDFGQTVKDIAPALQASRRALLAALAVSLQQQTGGIDVSQMQQQLQQEKRELTEALKSAENSFRQLERSADKAQTELSSLKSQMAQGLQEQSQLALALEASLAKVGLNTIQELKQAALGADEIKRLELKLHHYATQKESLEGREVELQARLSGRSLETGQLLSLQQDLKQTQLQLDELKDSLGRTKQQLSDIEVMLTRALQLRKESEALSKVFDTFDFLAKDLRGNKFQDYLLNQMQSKLAARASHMISEVTDQRYDLRLIEGEYQVFDAWTEETRSVKTLSGGETFIVSLSLALALSDLLAGNKALGALFLDEGFGMLDAETLEQVADVLESLSHQGRMVGVITHVQALSERLPARLMVQKHAEGSRISWDM